MNSAQGMPSTADSKSETEGETVQNVKKRKRNNKSKRPDPITLVGEFSTRCVEGDCFLVAVSAAPLRSALPPNEMMT